MVSGTFVFLLPFFCVQTGGVCMQKARPEPHAPATETTKQGADTNTLEGGVGEAQPHKSADLQVRLEAMEALLLYFCRRLLAIWGTIGFVGVSTWRR